MPANIKILEINKHLKHNNIEKSPIKHKLSTPTKSLDGKYITPTFYNDIHNFK